MMLSRNVLMKKTTAGGAPEMFSSQVTRSFAYICLVVSFDLCDHDDVWEEMGARENWESTVIFLLSSSKLWFLSFVVRNFSRSSKTISLEFEASDLELL